MATRLPARCRSAIVVVALSLAGVLSSSESRCQELDGPLKLVIRFSKAVAIDESGYLSQASVPETIEMSEGALLQSLLSERIVSEFDLTAEQVDQLKAEKKRLDRIAGLMTDLKREMTTSGESSQEGLRIAERIAEEAKVFKRAIQDCLLPHQQRRLAQLQARQALAELGLEAALVERQGEEMPTVGESSAEALQQTLRELRTEAAEQRIATGHNVRVELTKILTRQQRELLEQAVGDCAGYLAPSAEILHWQFLQPTPKHRGIIKSSRLEDLYFAPTQFHVSLGGGVARPSRAPTPDVFQRFWMICAHSRYGRIDIVDFQMLASGTPTMEEIARQKLLQQRLRELNRHWLEGTVTQEFLVAEGAKLIDEFQQWKLATRIGELLPHQQQEVERVILRRLIGVRGIKLCLTDGSLGELLEISDPQRKQIDDMATRLSTSIEKSSRSMEQTIWTRIHAVLTPAERARFTEIFGSMGPAEHIMPSSDMLLAVYPKPEKPPVVP